ncbi:MAG: extracellular solute-binding protein [Desulfobacula sp.]|nr:extracellular solute-binding protein [Desulfobacula sp.]
MKYLIITVSLAIICTGLIYFSIGKPKQIEPPLPTKSKEKIGFYHYYSGTLSGGISEMIEEVNKEQTDFEVSARALDHEAFKSMIHTTLDKGNPPELFSYWAGARVQNLVDQKKLAPIDDLWEKENFDKKFSTSVIKAASTYNGSKYLLPIAQFVVMVFYNKTIFEANGLQPPTSWEEFIAVCQKLKKNKITPIALGSRERWPAQFWMDYLLLRTQPIEYRNRLMNGKAKYTDQEVKKVYQIWSELLKEKYFNQNANQLDWAQATQLVCKKDAAMTLMGSWAIQLFEDEKQCSGPVNNFDFFPFPTMDMNLPKVALGPIDGIVLSKNSANHDFAKKTLSYFAKQKPQERLSIGSGALAPSLEVPLSFYSPFKKRMIEEIKSSKYWAFNYDLATPPRVAELGMDSFNELIEFPDQYEKILENVETEAHIIFNEILNNDPK